ncbi:MAG: hypothetical protein U9Q70_10270 [Chloroflexota bacterium]|nr:hypothetical protein [Chloroflexota bacterium]
MTSRQRWILGLLTVVLLGVVSTLGGVIWTTSQKMTSVSLLPTPTRRPTVIPSPTPSPHPSPTPTPFFATGQAGEIARDVAAARELLPRWETPLTFVNTYDLSVVLYRRFQEDPPFPLSSQLTLQALGLWPLDSLSPDPVVQAQKVAALYSPTDEQIYLRRDWTGSAEVVAAQVAYGYAQALPEQHGNLPRLREEPSSLDRRLALEAVAAGDAWITFARYAGQAVTAEPPKTLLDTLPVWPAGTPLVTQLNQLPWEIGQQFAATLYRAEGFAALDEVLRRPPHTTEQLLHPAEYQEYGDFVAFDPLEPAITHGWNPAHTETVGQAVMRFALDQWSTVPLTSTTAEGWNGDLLQLWLGPQNKKVVLWQTAWDSRLQAMNFDQEVSKLLPHQVRDLTTVSSRPAGLPSGTWWANRWGAAFVYRYFDHVWLVWGDDATLVADVATAISRVRSVQK